MKQRKMEKKIKREKILEKIKRVLSINKRRPKLGK